MDESAMKQITLAVALFISLFATLNSAAAQCNGNFGADSACGTVGGGLPGPIPFSSIISGSGAVIGSGTSTIGCAAPWANTTGTLLGNNCAFSISGTTITVPTGGYLLKFNGLSAIQFGADSNGAFLLGDETANLVEIGPAPNVTNVPTNLLIQPPSDAGTFIVFNGTDTSAQSQLIIGNKGTGTSPGNWVIGETTGTGGQCYPLDFANDVPTIAFTMTCDPHLQIKNNIGIYGRNAANSADILMMNLDASNILQIGASGDASISLNKATSLGSLLTLTGTEGNQLEWTLGGQSWKVSMASGGNWYLLDATNSKFPINVGLNTPVVLNVGNSVAGALALAGNFVPTVTYTDALGSSSLGWTGIYLAGSSSGVGEVVAPSAASTYTWTLPAATDTIAGIAAAQILTNKTLASSTDLLGGVTADFGSDAKGDVYTNSGSSNVIERLAIGSTNDCLIVTSGLPAWSSAACLISGGALGTPSSGTVTNLTGTASININGTVGATTPTTGVFTTVGVGITPVATVPLQFKVGTNLDAAFVKSSSSTQVELATVNDADTVLEPFLINASTLTIAAPLYLTGLTSGSGSAALCLNATGSQVESDTSSTICGISALRYKNLIAEITPDQGVAGIMGLRGESYTYKSDAPGHANDKNIHISLIADDMAAMNHACAEYSDAGVENYMDRCFEAYQVAFDKKVWELLKQLKQPH